MKCCWYDVDDDHQACELCEEVAEVIGRMEGEPRHAVAEDQAGAQHQLGKILNIIQVRNKKCEIRNIFLAVQDSSIGDIVSD